MTDKRHRMTTAAGVPVGDNQNSLTAGPRGPVLTDYQLMEKMAHFNRERVPERVVHAKGAGAYGKFTVTGDVSKYTCAKIFSRVGNSCETFARFSTVAGELGSADTARDPRGFAVKFYTEEGNWDMVGNNTPVFFIRDPLKFSDFIHSQKRDPRSGMRDATMQWDFWSLSPESMHQVTWLFGDRGIPATLRHMNGYSSHTYSLWNAKGERYWVKWHFKTVQGIRNMTAEEATRVAGEDLDYHRRDLFNAIEKGNFRNGVMAGHAGKDAETYPINPSTSQGVAAQGLSLDRGGVMELNHNPENYFAEVEQAAFEPAIYLPAWVLARQDAPGAAVVLPGRTPVSHRHQLAALAVNKPKCPVMHHHRDGQTRFDGTGARPTTSRTASAAGGRCVGEGAAAKISGDADRYDHRAGNDDYTQAGNLYRLMSAEEKARLVTNLVGAMKGVPREIQMRQIGHFTKADPSYGEAVARGLGIDINSVKAA
jgi:catalase